ncbi:hypothetical protein EAI_03026 [Harpegnathos saltator]|uniref:Uncharacterized protein n=1 Tax=Harpegnathos saltator TaxID=610380 RepID=E2BE11_HARSA|nr:hypothetical protein EAI_03026 [Harpegnathos saltator]
MPNKTYKIFAWGEQAEIVDERMRINVVLGFRFFSSSLGGKERSKPSLAITEEEEGRKKRATRSFFPALLYKEVLTAARTSGGNGLLRRHDSEKETDPSPLTDRLIAILYTSRCSGGALRSATGAGMSQS